jgi:hypothetical protein
MKYTRIVFVGLVTASAAAVGYFAGMSRGSDERRSLRAKLDEVQASSSHLEAENRTLTALRERPQRTEQSAKPIPARAATDMPTSTPLQSLRVLADLQQRKLVRPTLTFLDRRGKLDESFVSLFALNATEQEQLQHSIDIVRSNLADLERANATMWRDPSGNIVVSVAPFPQEGGAVYDGMMQRFAQILGPDRNDAFRTLGAEQFENLLGRFGAAERTYTFGYDETERPGQPYTFQDKVVQRTPKGGLSGNTNNTRFHSFDELAARVGPIVSILPPEYGRPK